MLCFAVLCCAPKVAVGVQHRLCCAVLLCGHPKYSGKPKIYFRFSFEVCISDLARGSFPAFVKKEAQRNLHTCTETKKCYPMCCVLVGDLCRSPLTMMILSTETELSKSHSNSDSYVVDASEQDIQQLPLDPVLHGLASIRP